MNESSGFDWNLLKCLDALLAERNVTRAALRVGLSQPAMSRALGRLRVVFEDELFVRSPGGVEPTARALALTPLLATVRECVGDAVHADAFDPRTSVREFNLGGADFGECLVMPVLAPQLAQRAPGMSVNFSSNAQTVEQLLLEGGPDLLITPRMKAAPARVIGKKLFDEEFVCLVRQGHPLLKGKNRKVLTLNQFCELAHVLIAPRGRPGGVVDRELAKLGRSRRVAARVSSFLVAPLVVAESDMITTIPRTLAKRFARQHALVILQPPIDVPPFSMMQYWALTKQGDLAHQYLRGQVQSLFAKP